MEPAAGGTVRTCEFRSLDFLMIPCFGAIHQHETPRSEQDDVQARNRVLPILRVFEFDGSLP